MGAKRHLDGRCNQHKGNREELIVAYCHQTTLGVCVCENACCQLGLQDVLYLKQT